MKQLTQKLMDGKTTIIEVPPPVLSEGMILVRSAFSVISAGTEGSKVRAARKSLIGKARERPQQARQMFDLLRQSGPVQAYRTAMKKLDAYSPLGYTCAGVVIGVGEGVTGFAVGDKVACAGTGASHSEIVLVSENLTVRLDPDADLQAAAYNALGAIALQGVRQADLRLGEFCAVIGLGIIGQLTCLLLKCAGVAVIGIDVDPEAVRLANEHATDFAALRDEPGLLERIQRLTRGLGVDAVIITAGSQSTDPINFSGAILRKRGKVVVVGSVPTGFDREPHFYQKELELRMSCSYGPGRYDPAYEERGIDYPVGYVRWTERRNMEAFQEGLLRKRIDVAYLTTHAFDLQDAPQAYDMIAERQAFHLGVVIRYGDGAADARAMVPLRAPTAGRTGSLNLAFVGAGSYAMSHLLPNLPKDDAIRRVVVMTASGLSSRSVAERFTFEACTTDEKDVFGNPDIDTVFVATRHDSHARYVELAIRSGKNVYVEKPLCISEDELQRIKAALDERGPQNARILFVGFNRRFAPLVSTLRETISAGPMAMTYRINAGALPGDSWILDVAKSGGRIIGEACHFIDLLTFLNGSPPVEIHAYALADANDRQDTLTMNVKFANGSVGVVSYLANGDKQLPKEYLEVHKGGVSAVLRDFKELDIHAQGKTATRKLLFQDKGQVAMVKAFMDSARRGGTELIPWIDIVTVTRATFGALESLRTSAAVAIRP